MASNPMRAAWRSGEHAAYDACGVGIVDLTIEATPMAFNTTAKRLLAVDAAGRSKLVELGNGTGFRFMNRDNDDAFQSALRNSSATADAPPRWFRIGRGRGSDLAAFVTSQPPARGARLYLLDPLRGAATASRSWCTLWHLTEAECRVAAALLEGKSTETVASTLGVTANAVRFHIKNLLSKTGVARQSQLMLLLSRTAYLDPA